MHQVIIFNDIRSIAIISRGKGWNLINHVGTCPKPEFTTSCVVLFFFRVQWVKIRGDSSFCLYLWNGWPSLLRLSFQGSSWPRSYGSWNYIPASISNMTSFFRFVDKRAIYRLGYNLISTCAGACYWLSS